MLDELGLAWNANHTGRTLPSGKPLARRWRWWGRAAAAMYLGRIVELASRAETRAEGGESHQVACHLHHQLSLRTFAD